MKIDDKLVLLRQEMKNNGIDVYIIPSSDPHQSEYVADHFKSREWISGFTGSAGTVVVSQDHAGLWTDSRYFLQAEEELKDSEFVLHKVIDRSYPNFLKYITDTFPRNTVVACDGNVFSYSQIKSYIKSLDEKGILLKTDSDLITPLWENRPPLPSGKLLDHHIKYCGISREEKFNHIRAIMDENNVDEYLIPALDAIAWILNARGKDIDFNPVFYSFGVLRKNDFLLFIDKNKIDGKLLKDFDSANISIMSYGDIYDYLKNINENSSIYLNSGLSNYNLYNSINASIVDDKDIITELKSIKNDVEISNIKKAHIVDGVALTKFYIWLENELKTRGVTEYEAVEKIAYFRSLDEDYYSESFGAIVGYKSNGAIIHYSPSKEQCSDIKPEGMLLIDSGGQYLTGTTDITRTTYFGTPSDEEKRNFTLVLKGHIAVESLVFPKGTNGYQIDSFARQYIWQYGLNYFHGTGHGVGFFLNVHEGPQGITSALGDRATTPIEPGMITSNEPGYYKDGHYGIRIENLILTIKSKETEFGEFYANESVTMFPYDYKLIDINLLTQDEIEWLNRYHSKVYSNLSPHLNDEEKKWLKEKCKKY